VTSPAWAVSAAVPSGAGWVIVGSLPKSDTRILADRVLSAKPTYGNAW
jgi:hypothetical protein